MTLDRFETRSVGQMKPGQVAGVPAFWFRSGMLVEVDGKVRPTSLANWRVTTAERHIADGIARLMGGSPEEWDTSKDDGLQVLTTTNAVQIVLSGTGAIQGKFVRWGLRGPVHECDGNYFLSPEKDAGKPCGCPDSPADRRQAARVGHAPGPYITVTFRLAEGYDLGVGQYVSTSWDLAATLAEVKGEVARIGGEALCELSLELVEYATKKGREVCYRKPAVTVIGPFSGAS
ncbi:hypothetical protein HEP87_29655 [Streptomyces sp. S1D4-11]|nr:hypothetical protein [Streptomyces sp. S1D4-11]QIY97386.1 hypothetical protein HEP87_29655 [Streptomyces sp. S1D4-11]